MCTQMMNDEYEVKIRGMLEPDRQDYIKIKRKYQFSIAAFNGKIKKSDMGRTQGMRRSSKESSVTPGIKVKIDGESDTHLDPSSATRCRQSIARCNFIAQDRPDIQYAVKEAAKEMSSPKNSDWEKVLKIGQF